MLIVFLLVLITSLHYLIDGNRFVSHLLHRELYFIPIVLAAFWFGKRGGLVVAVLCSVLFLPKILLMSRTPEIFSLSAIMEIPIYLVVGYLIGHIQDIRSAHWRSLASPPESPDPENSQDKLRVLVCIYNSPNVSKISRYVKTTFKKDNNLSINILGLTREPSETAFNSAEEYQHAKSDNERIVSELVQGVHQSLIEGGFSEQAVTKNFTHVQKETLARRILQEQQRSSYDTVVVPGEKMSRAEEFVMGNTAVRLVRELDCPVLTVY